MARLLAGLGAGIDAMAGLGFDVVLTRHDDGGTASSYRQRRRSLALSRGRGRARLADLDARRDRFFAAIGDGTGAPEARTAALRETEHQRAQILAQLAEVATLAQTAALDSPAFRRRLGSIVSTWRAALQKNIPSARQILRQLLVDRLRFTPAGQGAFLFEGAGRVNPLLVGTLVVPPLSKAMVPPGRTVQRWIASLPVRVAGRVRPRQPARTGA